jgi:hypothetical protein
LEAAGDATFIARVAILLLFNYLAEEIELDQIEILNDDPRSEGRMAHIFHRAYPGHIRQVFDLTEVLLREPYQCNNLARDTHKRPIRVGSGKEGTIMPASATW